MAQKTIAQLREIEVEKLAKIHCPTYTAEDMENAKKLMNSYYRLCGLSEKNFYNANNANTCNTTWHKASEEKEIKWYERLCKEFFDFAGLTLVYCGYFPSIGTKNKNTGFIEKINCYFY